MRRERGEIVSALAERLRAMMIGPRFKAELSFLPSRYALVNILLIVGAKKDIKILVVLWLLGRVYTLLSKIS